MFGASGLLWNLVSFGKFIHDNAFNFSKTFASVSLGFRYEPRHESNALLEIPEREPPWREGNSPGDAKLTSLKRCWKPVQVRLAVWSALYASCIHTWSLVLKQRPPSGFGFGERLGIGQSIQESDHFLHKGLAGRRFVFLLLIFFAQA